MHNHLKRLSLSGLLNASSTTLKDYFSVYAAFFWPHVLGQCSLKLFAKTHIQMYMKRKKDQIKCNAISDLP